MTRRHDKTLARIFEKPERADISWTEIENSLSRAGGDRAGVTRDRALPCCWAGAWRSSIARTRKRKPVRARSNPCADSWKARG